MGNVYVYSTLTGHQKYTTYRPSNDPHQLPQVDKEILIGGGSNVADKHFITPRGVVTKISEDDLAELEKNPDFQTHKKNGFITVSKSKVDPEVQVAKDMKLKDDSAPLSPEDEVFKEINKDMKVTTNKKE